VGGWPTVPSYLSSVRATPPCEGVETALLAAGDNVEMIVPGSVVMQ
jgi:hypothetical protein